jgi:phosphoserine phosphatase
MLEKYDKYNPVHTKSSFMQVRIETISLLPLCIDLDGTLIYNDVTKLSLRRYLNENFLRFAQVASWGLHGRAYLKQKLAKRVELDPEKLPYRPALLDYLKVERKAGRLIYLATAADQKYARLIADYLGIFKEVFASDGMTNLRGKAKAACLLQRFGEKKFVYAGNSFDDMAIWRHSAQAIVCSKSVKLLKAVEKLNLPLIHFT